MKPQYILITILAIFLQLSIATDGFCEFSLTVNPQRQSRDIRFDSSRQGVEIRNEEVTFTITSDQSKQYQLSQTFTGPLVNERGDMLDEDAIRMFSPSSVKGRLEAKLPTPMRIGEEILYTSNQAGDSDTFILVFAIDQSKITGSGIYETQITHILQAVDGSLPPAVTTRQIRLEVQQEFSLAVSNARGGRTLSMGRITEASPQGEGVLLVQVDSTVPDAYQIFGQLSSPIVNENSQELPSSKVKFSADIISGSGSADKSGELSLSPQLLLTSDIKGNSLQMQMKFFVSDLSGQQSGSYYSTLTFWAESDGGFKVTEPVTVPVEMEIKPVFFLEVKEAEVGKGLRFGSFRQGDDYERSRAMQLVVNNNMGTKYQISQIITGPMENADGAKVEPGNFNYWVSGNSESSFIQRNREPVEPGESIIFISDSHGSAANITVNYELNFPKDQKQGEYGTNITYSLSPV